jgi:hypothetical protein
MSTAPIAVRDLALLSGLFAAQAPTLSATRKLPTSAALLDYSQLTRQLLKQWWQRLEPRDLASGAAPLAAIAEEVLVSELMCRVVAGVFAVCDARGGRRSIGPFARSALLDLLQAKHWVLSRLVDGPQPLGALLRINQLRRKTERWSDCLLGSLPDAHVAVQFALDAERMRAFALKSSGSASQAGWYLTVVSLRLAMPTSVIQDSQRAETHRNLMRRLISFWPQEAFDGEGLLRGPLWQRLCGVTDGKPQGELLASPKAPADQYEVLRRRMRSQAMLPEDDDSRA